MATLPYANPDGMVVWDPQRGYVTVPSGPPASVESNWQKYQGRVLGSQPLQTLENRGSSLPPFLRVPMPWDTPSGFDPTMTNATYEHQKPVWDQSLSNTDMANWERTFQLYDESQLAAAQAKWDANMAQYGGMLPGGGVMGPRPTAPLRMEAREATPANSAPELSPGDVQPIVDRIQQALASGATYGSIAQIGDDLRNRGGQYDQLPAPIRSLFDRARNPMGKPTDPIGPKFMADLQAEVSKYQAGNNPDPVGGGDTMIPDPRAVYNPRPGGDSPYAPPRPVENFDGGWMSGGGVGVGSSGTGYTSGPMRDAPQSLPGTTSRWNDPRPGLGSPFPRPRETYGNPDLQGSGGWGRGWNPQGWRQGSPWTRPMPQQEWNAWPRGEQSPGGDPLGGGVWRGTYGGGAVGYDPRPIAPRPTPSQGGGSSVLPWWNRGGGVGRTGGGNGFTGDATIDYSRTDGGWRRDNPLLNGGYQPPQRGDQQQFTREQINAWGGALPSGMNGGGMPQPGGFRGWRS